jgi:hypothetical protein
MSSNITYYDWVPFFKSVAEKLNELNSNANKDIELQGIISQIFPKNHPLLRYSVKDPLSFIYCLAQKNTLNQRSEIYTKTKEVLNIGVNVPTDFIFPTPIPIAKASFCSEDGYTDGIIEIGNNLHWSFLSKAINGEFPQDEELKTILKITNVEFSKLSHVLFLINPFIFYPIEGLTSLLPLPVSPNHQTLISKIKNDGIQNYVDFIQNLRASFIGCELYEINLLNTLINSSDENQLRVSQKYCQISSWADGQEDSDYFDDFVAQNAVWTGGPAGRTGARVYPLNKYHRGDIVLVRRGTKLLGGVGVILNNQYLTDGYNDERVIKVIWMAKQNQRIDGTALGQWDGFSNASNNTIKHFQELYPPTFQILNNIRNKQRTMINHSAQKYKNLILQGPPGTGKTRMAKQIAQWLTSEDEKTDSLIQAIDKQIFKNEPEIEGNEQINLIQFHPSYTYEDFVRGIKVNADGDKISYDVENRILAAFAQEASKPENQHKAFVLIIDEINRANLTSVLGELIYALEYRGKNVNSLYKLKGGKNEIMLPHNLYIIGTMNTADRSVSHIDYAIRRRFTFIPVLSNDLAITHNKAKSLFSAITKIFDEHTSPEFDQQAIQIGHSYFLVDDNEIAMKLKYEIKPLLMEYISDGVLLESARVVVKDLNV